MRLVENFVPGTLERMGFAPEKLLSMNRKLVIVRLSGWGQTGPYRDKPGFGTLVEAMSGFADLNGFADSPPCLPPLATADMIAGLYAAIGLLTAVRSVEVHGGQGQVVDVSLFEPIFSLISVAAAQYRLTQAPMRRNGNQSTHAAPRNIYACADGHYVALSGSMQSMAERIFHAIGRAELVDDPRFRTNDERLTHRDALDEIIGEFIARRSRAENLSLFEAAGVTVGPVLFGGGTYRPSLCGRPRGSGRGDRWSRIVADAQCRYSFVRDAGIDKMGRAGDGSGPRRHSRGAQPTVGGKAEKDGNRETDAGELNAGNTASEHDGAWEEKLGRLSGKTCMVTGAARGIGASIADALLREGGNVVYADLDDHVTSFAGKAKDRAHAQDGRAIGVKLDVTDRKQVRAGIDRAVKEFGALHVMFNNAGINKPMNFLDVTEDNWNLIMKVNGLGVLIGMQEAAKQMIAQGTGGKIINTASIAGRQGYDNIAPYCASKFSVISLTQSGARALAKNNITVNSFSPGVVATPLWEQLDKDLMAIGASQRPGQAMSEFSAGILRGRAATPDDITGTTTFLASSDSDYMTGQNVSIDGGMVLV